MTDTTTQNGSNEPNLETLVARLAELKKLEDDAKLARVEHESRILPFLEQIEEGSKTTTLANGTKVTVKNGYNRRLDQEAWKRIKHKIPENLRPVQVKEVLNDTSLRYLKNNEPDFYKEMAAVVTTSPAKPYLTIKEA